MAVPKSEIDKRQAEYERKKAAKKRESGIKGVFMNQKSKLASIQVIPDDKELKIRVTDLNVVTMSLTGDGLKLELRESETLIGKLAITSKKLVWYEGEIHKHGQSINWPEFFDLMKDRGHKI